MSKTEPTNPKPAREAPMLYIGATVESVNAARAAINDILASPAASEPKVAALNALSALCAVNANVSNCNFQG